MTFVALLLFGSFTVVKADDARSKYIENYKNIALKHEVQYGIPASITMAQGILESGDGNSTLARKSNNHFGIKCKSDWKGKRVYHDDDAKGECFRAYSSVELSYSDHAEFLKKSPRYASLFSHPTSDYKSWAHGLKAAGYATAPDYAERLIKLIEDNSLQYLATTRVVSTDLESASLALETIPNSPIIGQAIANENFTLYNNNGALFIIVRQGDTLDSIARFFNLSRYTLRRYNDLDRGAQLREGEVIYVGAKATKWRGHHPQHVVKRGETLRSISQSYGIKLKSLRKYNKLSSRDMIYDGQRIELRKN